MIKSIIIATILAAVPLISATSAEVEPNIWPFDKYVDVKTDAGIVRGKIESGVQVFHSIPFAAPPVGKNRFRAPQPLESWTGIKKVYDQPNICAQIRTVGDVHLGDEDCLYLHVYVPPNANLSSPLPVMFWIFGGGYRLGDGFEFGLYSGTTFAKQTNTILVAANYRVGALGFLSLESLAGEEGAHNSTGNYGVQDQRAALQWVNRNIENFGGDKNKVTIFGESAGAFSVCWHLAHPLSKGLFSAAIMQSGSCSTDIFFRSRPDQVAYSTIVASKFGCNEGDPDVLDCLRSTPVGKILTPILKPWPTLTTMFPGQLGEILDDIRPIPPMHPVMPWGPVVDESLEGTPEEPYYAIQGGRGNYVDVIFGSNQDEGTIFVYALYAVVPGLSFPINDDDLAIALNHFFDDIELVEEVLLRYTKADYNNDNFKRAAAVIRDFFFLCETRRSARAMSNHGSAVWNYWFVYPIRWVDGLVLGNYHASELFFVFGNEFPPVVHGYNAKDKQMSNSFLKFWGNFAHHRNPNGPNANADNLEWPNFLPETDLNILMDHPTSIQKGLRSSFCDLWDTLLPPALAKRPGGGPRFPFNSAPGQKHPLMETQ